MATLSRLLAQGNPPVVNWFPHEGPVMWSFDVFLVITLHKLFNKQLCCIIHIYFPQNCFLHSNDSVITHQRKYHCRSLSTRIIQLFVVFHVDSGLVSGTRHHRSYCVRIQYRKLQTFQAGGGRTLETRNTEVCQAYWGEVSLKLLKSLEYLNLEIIYAW